MGLFDFVQKAGLALGGGKELTDAEKAKEIKEVLADFGIKGRKLDVTVQGTKAIVEGKLEKQSEKEKMILAVGNVQGIAQVEDRIEVEDDEPPAQMYTVVSGDTLGGIAKKFYGKASKYPVIFEANKPMLKDPDKIYPGQVLRIPPLD